MNDPQPEGSHGKPHRTTKILSHARRRGGRVAARGKGAGRRPAAAPRHLDGGSRERPAISSRRGGIPGGTSKARMGGRAKYSDRSSLGRVRCGDDATVCEGAHRTATRPYSLE